MELIRLKKGRKGAVRVQIVGGNGEILLTSEPLSGLRQAEVNLAAAHYALSDQQNTVLLPDGSTSPLSTVLQKREEIRHDESA